MTKEEAIVKIRKIQGGGGVNRNIVPKSMRGRAIIRYWDDGFTTLAFEYGYIMCLMETFGIDAVTDMGCKPEDI